MNLLLAFMPFLAFALIDRHAGPLAGLVAGSAVSLLLVVRDRLKPAGRFKTLELGTLVLFAALTAYALRHDVSRWPPVMVRLCLDLGLTAIAVAGLLLRKPFTLQYAPAGLPAAVTGHPRYLRTHMAIAAGWATAFALISAGDVALMMVPGMTPAMNAIVTAAALFAALAFMKRTLGEAAVKGRA